MAFELDKSNNEHCYWIVNYFSPRVTVRRVV